MAYFRNCWYMAGWAAGLDKGPIGRTLLNEPVAMFRDGAGAVHAVGDRCPHRFVKLSGGRVVEGALECPYHGLRFDGAGQCVHNPQGPPPRLATVASYRLVEQHSILWIWMGDQASADVALIPDFSCNDPLESHVCGGYIPMNCNYRFGTDNILDLSHIQFSHRDSLAPLFEGATNEENSTSQVGDVVWSNRRYRDVPANPANDRPGDSPVATHYDRWLNVRWHAPSAMLLHSGSAPAGSNRTDDPLEGKHTHIFTPETEQTCHYWYGVTRPKASFTLAQTEAELDRLRHPFETEDKPMLAEQQQAFGDQDFWQARPIVLKGDAAAIRARRILDKLIRTEAAMTKQTHDEVEILTLTS